MADSNVKVRMVFYAVIYAALSATTTVPKVAAAMSCDEIKSDLTPCLSFVLFGGFIVPQACCDGARTVYGAAQTTPDRQALCSCIINAIRGAPYTPYNVANAAAIPPKCGLSVPYPITPDIDCSSVK